MDFGVYLVDDLLVKTDRASMAHSLEARVPFLDPVVTNLAFALPARHKVRGLAKKVLLRKAVEPLLPREVVHGRKRGFSIPAAAWLRGELEPFARETLSASTLGRQGFFRPETVTRLVDEHVAGSEDRSRQLWGLLAFTLWYERHVEQEPPQLHSARMEALRRVRVWIDMTASAHVLVFRPLVELLRGRGDEVEITARHYAQTLQLLELHGLEPDAVIGRHGGRSRVQKARQMTHRLGALRRLGEGPRLRRRARARLARADADGPPARHPQLDDVRLRVRDAAAPDRLPGRDEGGRPGRDPAGAARSRTACGRRSSCSTRA